MATPRQWITRASIAACVVLTVAIVATYVVNPHGVQSLNPRDRVLGIGLYRIPSESMAPTFRPGRVLVFRMGTSALRDLHRGDVVVFAPPHHPEQVWMKRIAALPGETVALRGGVLTVDGRAVAEPFVDRARVRAPYSLEYGPHRVPDDGYFLLGDNRDNSEDSRFWGDARASSLRGRLWR